VSRLRVALVQLAADQDVAANVERAAALVRKAGESKPGLIALPEMFQYRGPLAGFRESATQMPGPLTEPFSDLARELNCWILLGSLAERSTDPLRPFNTSVLLDPAGGIAALYRKRHLFDVAIDDGPSDRESARITPGDSSVVAVLEGVAEEVDVRLG
jgi:predicted amidohydrolase